jgi:RNA polymerase sigma-70 factor (ECF subfamily)
MKDMVGLSAVAERPVAIDDGEGVSSALLSACQAGDRTALERLFTDQAPRVYRWAVLLGLSGADAEDVAQEVLATAARRIGTCEAEAALSSWLYQITRRVVANARRSAWVRRIFRRGEDDDAVPAFVGTAQVEPDTELAVRRCFKRLSVMQAEVLLLCEVEGYTRPEVAQMLGVPEGTVASRLRLARDAFRRQWQSDAAVVDEGGGP